MFGKGISRSGDILDVASNLDLIQKSGAWYAIDGEKIGQGRENAKQFLEEHLDVMNSLDKKIREHYGLGAALEGPASSNDGAKTDPDDSAKGKTAKAKS